MNAATALAGLKENGHRISRGRKAILDVFQRTHKPLSAVEVLELLSKKGIMVNKTTVYRELTFLKDQSLLKKVPISSNTVYYESALQNHHHHLICQNCHKIAEVETHEFEETIEHLSKRVLVNQHFSVQDHSLEFFGRCASCQ